MHQFLVNRARLLSGLEGLSPKKRLGFGLLAVERMFPCLVRLSKLGAFDISPFLIARDLAWQSLTHSISSDKINDANEVLSERMPDSEKSYGADLDIPCAISAASAIGSLLDFLQDGKPENLALVGELAMDGIYLCSDVEGSGGEITEADLAKAYDQPLIQMELESQESDLSFLGHLSEHFDQHLVMERSKTQRAVLPQCVGFAVRNPHF
jgi:hypothetical protein